MNRRIAAWTIAAVAVLGLTACSGTPSSSDDTTKTESSAPAEETSEPTSEQSVADACASATTQIQSATQSLTSLDVSAASADPQGTVDTFTESVDAIGAAAESVSNPEVKAAVTAVYEDFGAMRDLLAKVLIEQDMSVATEMTAVSTDVQESALAVSELCAG